MATTLYLILFVAIVVLLAVWAVARARRIRGEAEAREAAALAALAGGRGSAATAGETEFADGLPTHMPAGSGIDVADVSEVVDIDALLADESRQVAKRARATLEEPTDIYRGLDSLPPLPRPAAARPVAVVRPPPPPPPRQPVAPAVPTTAGRDVPLRELALAWFEARGYRPSPASAAVRPIELVLRHKDDAARAYAFVLEQKRVDDALVGRLLKQARSIGLIRLLIVADAGCDPAIPAKHKGVRVVDRVGLDGEFRKLDVPVAAKIIAVARRRATAPRAVA